MIPLLRLKDLTKPLRYALLTAAGGCLFAETDFEDGGLISCLVTELTQTHEQTLL